MPFRHPDRSQDLAARIEFEVRERLEEAIDYVCLQALVRERKARGLPPPAADNSEDRRAYTGNVLALLRLLRQELTGALGPEEQRKITGTTEAMGDEQALLIAVQVAMARRLPDYWQRFEAISDGYLADPTRGRSGSEGSGLIARLLGRR
jgi:transposase InsO family protein